MPDSDSDIPITTTMGEPETELTPEMEEALLAEDEEDPPLDNNNEEDVVDDEIIEIPDDSNSNSRFMTNGSGSGAEEEEDFSDEPVDGDDGIGPNDTMIDSVQDIGEEDDDDDVVELDQDDEPSNLSSSYNDQYNDVGSGGEEDDDDVVPLDDEDQPSPAKRMPISMPSRTRPQNPGGDDGSSDIMEIAEDDPLGGGAEGYYEDEDDEPLNEDEESKNENSNEVIMEEESDSTSNTEEPKRVNFNGIKISSSVTVSEVTSSENDDGKSTLINITTSTPNKTDSESEGENTSSTTSNSQKPTLVLIDTKSILSGKGPVPMKGMSGGGSSGSNQVNCIKPIPKSDILLAPQRNTALGPIKIPDDAFLIEAPSFIVPYVFEQTGEKALKEHLKELKAEIKKEKQEKAIANGEPEPSTEEEEDKDKETDKKPAKTEDYFESPVGKLLVNLGMSLVQEFVQVDLLKMQRRKADKERAKNRAGSVSMQTQQSIISLKNNVEDSKENNAPFHFTLQKCRQCNFRSESDLVMSTHLETPHMRHNMYRCNFCKETVKMPHEILIHMETEHKVRPRLERAPALHQCINCSYEDNSKAKITRHLIGCAKRFHIEKNLEPPSDWDTPAKLPKLPKNRLLAQGNFAMAGSGAGAYMNAPQLQQVQGRNVLVQYPTMKMNAGQYVQQGTRAMNLPPLLQAPKTKPLPGLIRTNPGTLQQVSRMNNNIQKGMMMRGNAGQPILNSHMVGNQLLQQVVNSQLNVPVTNNIPGYLPKLGLSSNATALPNQRGASLIRNSNSNKSQPSISITPLPRHNPTPPASASASSKPPAGKTSFVICEICDGYIKDLDQLRNHMQWIHKVKIHPKMIYNKPPLNCQKCQFRFFTDQGLERHLLGSHGLVTSSMQEAANKGQDNGRCPLCGKVYQWKLLAHVAKDHNVTLKPAHLSYKCTVCTATFGMYKLFESHVYSAHSMNSKRNTNGPAAGGMGRQINTINNNQRMNQMQMKGLSSVPQSSFKPLKINDEITIIPQPLANAAPLRSKGSLTITPHNAPINRRMRVNGDDGGIEIIEIDDGSPRASNGRKENGEFRGQLPISASTLRKRNLEISVCDSDGSDDSFHRAAPPPKRLRGN